MGDRTSVQPASTSRQAQQTGQVQQKKAPPPQAPEAETPQAPARTQDQHKGQAIKSGAIPAHMELDPVAATEARYAKTGEQIGEVIGSAGGAIGGFLLGAGPIGGFVLGAGGLILGDAVGGAIGEQVGKGIGWVVGTLSK